MTSLPTERFNAGGRAISPQETDFLARMLQTADPLADAVIAELHRLGPEANQTLHEGLTHGRASLVNPPPAVDALLQQVEALPAWVEPDILRRGSTAYLTIEPLWNDISLSIGSLIHIYCSPAIARVLASTKDLTSAETAGHRLSETAVWVYSTMLPNGLVRGARGYIGTVQVRLLHARVRRANAERGWDTAALGVPINQVDMARTWLDFTYTPYRALTKFGFDFTEPELRDAYHLWQYLGYLLGIDPAFYRDVATRTDVATHAAAETLLDLLEVTNNAPTDDSRALVEPMMTVVTQAIVEALKSPFNLTSDASAAMVRFVHGDAIADELHLQRTPMVDLMPMLAFANRTAREVQRSVPGMWQRLGEQAVRKYSELVEANSAPAEYQRRLQNQPAVT